MLHRPILNLDDKGRLDFTLTDTNAAFGGEVFGGVIKQHVYGFNGRSYFVDIIQGLLIQRSANPEHNAYWKLSEFVTGVVKAKDGSLVVATQDGILMVRIPAGNELPEIIKLADIPGLNTEEGKDLRINNMNVVDGNVVFGTALRNPAQYLEKINSGRASRRLAQYNNLDELPVALRPAKLFMLDSDTLRVSILKEGFCTVNAIAGHTLADPKDGQVTYMTYADSAETIEVMSIAKFGRYQGLNPTPEAQKSFVGIDGRPDGTVAFMARNAGTGKLEHRFATACIGSNRVLILDLKLDEKGQVTLPESAKKPTMPSITCVNGMVDFTLTTIGGHVYSAILGSAGQAIMPVEPIAELRKFDVLRTAKGFANWTPGGYERGS